MPVLSIHLITFNNQDYLEEALNSILSQKVVFKYEIVIGDDLSSDNTWDIISRYKGKFPDLISTERNAKQLGILKNFKKTLDRCSGDYVFALAGDDMLKDDHALDKMYTALKKNPNAGFVDSGFDNYNQTTKKTIKYVNKDIINTTNENYKRQLLLGRITPIGICFSKVHLLKHVDFDHYLSKGLTIDDYPILVDLAMKTDFERINESLVTYRVHDDSYSHFKSFEKHYFLKTQMLELFNLFTKKYAFGKDIIDEYLNNHNKEILFLSAYFEKKDIGKEVYKKLKNKTIKDHIHFYASQNSLFRKLVSIF